MFIKKTLLVKHTRLILILILALSLISSESINFQVQALSQTSSVVITICGNGITEGDEVCDDGDNNGQYGYCVADCSALGPRCGDGIIQSEYGEKCDDGNTFSGDGCSSSCEIEEAPSPPEITAGGAVREEALPPPKTQVVFKGRAYPNAEVNILKDGQVINTVEATPQANFNVTITDITPGNYTFGIWAKDKYGRKSIIFSFSVTVSSGMTTTINGIFIPPTIELGKTKVSKGEAINISGQSIPTAIINIYVESPEIIVKETRSDEFGDWHYVFDTEVLEEGAHLAKAKAVDIDGSSSGYSNVLRFYVGKLVLEELQANTDFNKDGRINLIDFSILLFWWNRYNPCVDTNYDNVVDLVDLSIMMYWWTG